MRYLFIILLVTVAFGQHEDIGTAQEMSAADSLEYRLATIQWQPSDSVAFAKAEAKFDKTKLKQRKQKKQKKSKPGAYNWTTRHGLEWTDDYIWVGGKVFLRHYHRWHEIETKTIYREAKW